MPDLRIFEGQIWSRLVNGGHDGQAMSKCQFQDRVPEAAQLTAYDESHLADYLRLLDADAEGADWRQAAASVFGIDVTAEPDRAKAMH